MENSNTNILDKNSADSSIASQGKRELKCSQCSLVFKYWSSLSCHIASKCGQVKNFPCNNCDKNFDRHDSPNRHIKLCKGKKSAWKCLKCDKEFELIAYLKICQMICLNRSKTNWKKIETDASQNCESPHVRLSENKQKKSTTVKTASSTTSATTAAQKPLQTSPSQSQLVILEQDVEHEDT